MGIRLFVFCVVVMLFANGANAAPPACNAGSEGTIIYNKDQKLVQFCNGTDWIGMVGSFGGGGTDTLADLACQSGDVPEWNGTSWVCGAGGTGLWTDSGNGYLTYTGTDTGIKVQAITGMSAPSVTLADAGCANDEILKWDGDSWECAADGGGLTALQGQDDAGSCTLAKDGLIRYRTSGNPKWEYCDGGTTSWLPFRLPQCQNDGAGECTLSALRSADDAQFVASNILSGVNILGVTGSATGGAAACTNDSTAECTLSATRSSGDPQFAASNIRCGVNVLGVTGTSGSGNSSGFSFTDATNVNPSTLTTASAVTISGLPAGCPGQVTVSGQGNPQISIAGGAWTNFGIIQNGETLAVRLTSSASFTTAHVATVSVGTTQDAWSVTTRAGDSTPDAFSFTDVTNQVTSSVITSNTITPAGYEGSVPVSVSGQGSPQISINGGGWVTSGTITAGQTLAVRLTSSASFVTAHVATVDVGGVTDNWSVTTIPEVTFIASDTSIVNSSSSTHTHTGLNIGTASPTRLVVAFITARHGSGSQNVSSVTIGGISATLIRTDAAHNSGTTLSALYAAIIPTGTTATVVVNYTGTLHGSALTTASFNGFTGVSINSQNGAEATDNGNIISANSITTPAGGIKIAVCAQAKGTTTTFTNATEQQDFEWTASAIETHASAWNIHPTQQTNQTITCTFGANDTRRAISAAALMP